MTARALAWRTVKAKPARAALAIVGVTVIGALLLDMLLLSRGLLISFRTILESGGYDVRVVATDTLPTVRVAIPDATSFVREIARLPEVQEAAFVRRDQVFVSRNGRPSASVTMIAASDGAERRAWQISAGRNLAAAGEPDGMPPVLVSRRLADEIGTAPGETIRISPAITEAFSAVPPVAFRVAGIAEFNLEAGEGFVAATTIGGFALLENQPNRASGDEADIVLAVSRTEHGPMAAAAAIARVRPDLRTYSNDDIVAQFNQNGFTYFRQISFVLSSITLAFAFLLIGTLLSVSVNQRLHEVAALRALGVGRRRIAATLVWEAAWLVGLGGALSLPVGGLLAMELDRILRRMPGLPHRLHFFVFDSTAVLLHIGLLVLAGAAAALYPIWIATRLPIAATLRRETIS
jgi:putative ABC transport system permease protein